MDEKYLLRNERVPGSISNANWSEYELMKSKKLSELKKEKRINILETKINSLDEKMDKILNLLSGDYK